ncbi:11595_t:CDS:1, partial [Funneliformis caledonium]
MEFPKDFLENTSKHLLYVPPEQNIAKFNQPNQNFVPPHYVDEFYLNQFPR